MAAVCGDLYCVCLGLISAVTTLCVDLPGRGLVTIATYS